MASPALHVACCYAGAAAPGGQGTLSVLGPVIWSQTFTSPGVTTQSAPGTSSEQGSIIFSVRSGVDVYFATGTAPDASEGSAKRRFLPANQDVDVRVNASDKLAWIGA